MDLSTRNRRINGLDLFSGIGGNSLALRQYIKTIAYCETDRHAQSVLLSRMAGGDLELAPIWDNIETLTVKHLDILPDIICAGFPCQDISVAGSGLGLGGGRSGLFYEVVRLAQELKPTFIFLENVPAIRTRGLDRVIEELTEVGYDCRWTMLSASDIGAPHRRERWFLLGKLRTHTYSTGLEGQRAESSGVTKKFEDTSNDSWWSTESSVVRVANAVPQRVDRIKRLGNAVVPQQARLAFELLITGNI